MYFLSKAEIDIFGLLIEKYFIKRSIRKNSFSFILIILFVLMVNTLYAAAPTWPASKSLQASQIQSRRVTLTWTPASTNTTQYKVLKNGVSIYQGALTSRTYTVEGLTQYTAYTFKIEAGNSSNQWSTTGPLLIVTTKNPPTWPTGSSVIPSYLMDTQVTLTWNAATNGVIGYKVLQNGIQYGITPNLTMTVTGLSVGGTYPFKVEAYGSEYNTTLNGPSITVTTISPSIYDSSGHYCYKCHGINPVVPGGPDVFSGLLAVCTGARSDTLYRHGFSAEDQADTGSKLSCGNCHEPMHMQGPLPGRLIDPLNPAEPFTMTMVNPTSLDSTNNDVKWIGSDGPPGSPNIFADMDTYLEPGSMTHGGDQYLVAGFSNDNEMSNRILLHFDLALAGLPPDAKILLARMRVLADWAGDIEIHKVTKNWEEANATMLNAGVAAGNWAEPGGDYDPAVLATNQGLTDNDSFSRDHIPGTYEYLTFDITELVREWQSGQNFGLLIKLRNPGSYLKIHSKNDPTGLYRPQITGIAYTTKPDAMIELDSIAFCTRCHGRSQPPSVQMGQISDGGVGLRPFRNIAYTYMSYNGINGDPHGGARRSGVNLKPGILFYPDMAPLPCTICHDPHGTSNPYHLKEKINKDDPNETAVIGLSTSNTDAYRWNDWCGKCHITHGGAEPCIGCHHH